MNRRKFAVVVGIESGSRVLMRAPEPRWPEESPRVGIPAVEAKSMAGRLLSMVFAGEVEDSAGVLEECTDLTAVCMRG